MTAAEVYAVATPVGIYRDADGHLVARIVERCSRCGADWKGHDCSEGDDA